MAEYNPVTTAPNGSNDPWNIGILGNTYGWGGQQTVTDSPGGTTTSYQNDAWMPDINTIDPSTLTQAPGLPDFGSMNDSQLSSYLGSPDFGSLLSSLSGLTGGGGSKPASSSSSGGWLQNLISSLTGGAGGTGLGPYAATAGIGIYEAKQAQKDAQAKANELKALGTPFLDQSKALLDQYKSGTLRPDQQKLVDFTSQQGQNLIQSGTALSAIAQQAFEDYKAGKLPAADEKRLQDQATAQKQAVRQRLGGAGIVDSTILTAQDQLIDDQAMQQRQALLDARFATGNQAYDQWLKSTEAGQQLVVQGQQFASQAFETMLNDALGFGQAGMEPVASSIALAMQSDKELSDSITQLLGNLASAYAYTVAGPGNAGGGGAAGGAAKGGGGGSTLQSIVGGIGSIASLWGSIGKLFGGGNPSGAGGQAANTGAGTASQIGGSLADAASIYGGVQKGGVAGTAQAASGAIDLAGRTGAVSNTANLGGVDLGSAAGFVNVGANLAQGDYGGAGFAAADLLMGGPYAAVGNLVAGSLNKAFLSDSSKDRNVAAYKQATGATTVNLPLGRTGKSYNVVSDGKGGYQLVSAQDFNDLAGSWYGATFAPDGNPAEWQQKYQSTLQNLKQADLPQGYTFDASTGKIMYKGKVAGNYG